MKKREMACVTCPVWRQGGGFCSMSCQRAPPEWQTQVGFLTRPRAAPSLGGRVGFPCANSHRCVGEWWWVFVVPDMCHYLCIETAGAWCSLSVFALQCCLMLGDGINQRKRKMMGVMSLDMCPGWGDAWIICEEVLVSLTLCKDITEGKLVDTETETLSRIKVSWEWILLLKLLTTEKVLRSVSEIWLNYLFLTYLCQVYLGLLLLLYDQNILPSWHSLEVGKGYWPWFFL